VNLPNERSQSQDRKKQQSDFQVQELKKQELKRQVEDASWRRFWAYLCVILGGAFGGLIYGVSRNRGAVIPHFLRQQDGGSPTPYNKLDLGFVGDMLIGIGGGIIVFNLVPQADNDIFESLFINSTNFGKLASLLMKIAALSLIGGFAGISLFDEAAKRISQELEDVRTKAEANSGLISTLQNAGNIESDIQYLLNPLVDSSFPPLNDSQKNAFKKLLLKAPLNLRNKVFERLQNAHNSNMISGKDVNLSKPEIESRIILQQCLLDGFISLIDAADEQESKQQGTDLNKHRYVAHKGFIYDQLAIGNELLDRQINAAQHWRLGEGELNAAIQLRDQIPADRGTYWYYNLERMLCRFKQGRHDEVMVEINSEGVQSWIQKGTGIINSQITLMPSEFLGFLQTQLQDKPRLKELLTVSRLEKPNAEPSVQAGPGIAGPVMPSPPIPRPEPNGSPLDGQRSPSLAALQLIRQRGSL
jgi:hypothetical protein